jgi:hypothetical protein
MYTVLGSGASTKVLAVGEHAAARTVTSCPHDAAVALAAGFESFTQLINAALVPVARQVGNASVETRRVLLSIFDTAVCGLVDVADDEWSQAASLVERVAVPVRDLSAATQSAVRAELYDLLDRFDGPLVVGRVVASAGRRWKFLDLVVSNVLPCVDWEYMLGPHSGADVADVGYEFGPCVLSDELSSVLAGELYHCSPYGSAFEPGVADLYKFEHGDTNPITLIAPGDLVAWVACHRPVNVDALRELLDMSDS